MSDLRTLLPEVLLLGGAVGCLLLGSWTPRHRQGRVVLLAGLVIVAAGAVSVHALGGAATTAYSGTVTVDGLTGILRLSVLGSLLVVLMLVRHELADSPRESEVVVLLLLGGLGVLVLGASTDLAVLTVAFLLASIPLYGLIGLSPGAAAPEAVMKTYLLGALAGIWLMLGAAVLTGLTGTTAYSDLEGVREAPLAAAVGGVVLVVLGLLFKAGSVPMHFWVPDAVEGASTTAAAFLTTVPKLGAVVAAARLLEALPAQERWALLVAGLAAAGMVVGNLVALTQGDVRRLLGWSAVGQVGFLLAVVAAVPSVGEAAAVLGMFVVGYAAANLTCFAVLAAEPQRRTIAEWRGTGRASPRLVPALGVGLLALVGTPPTGVFVAKLLTFDVIIEAGLTWLAVLVALSTLIGLAYYLRWLAACLTAPEESGTQDHEPAEGTGIPDVGGSGRRMAVGVAGGCAAVAVLLGLAARTVLGTIG